MSQTKTQDLEQQAASAREQDDDQQKALYLLDQLEQVYHQENNQSGLAGVERSRFLNYKHLFLKTGQHNYRELAKRASEKGLEIALANNIQPCHYFFGLGEAYMLFEDYITAAKYYQKSLDYYQGTNTERGDFRYHLGEALYRAGKKADGKRTLLAGLKEIEDHRQEVIPFLANVWESGVHMRIAELLQFDQPEEALAHLKRAQQIAKLDPKLVIRRRQISKLTKQFK